MLNYKDFFEIMTYASTNWKGCYTPLEIAEYAHDMCNEYENCKKHGYVSYHINELYKNLFEDYSNGIDDADVEYWVDELADVAKF